MDKEINLSMLLRIIGAKEYEATELRELLHAARIEIAELKVKLLQPREVDQCEKS